GGDSWNAVNLLTSSGGVNVVAIDPLTPATLYVGTRGTQGSCCLGGGCGGPVLKSTDGGSSWTEVNVHTRSSGHINALAIGPSPPTTLYAGTCCGGLGCNPGVFKSTDGGSSWSTVLPSRRVYSLAIDPTTPTILYTGTDNGVLKSTTGGSTWNTV